MKNETISLSAPTNHHAVQFAALAVAFYLLHSEGIAWLYREWSEGGGVYAHGFFIPILSAYLIWKQREHLKAVPATPAPILAVAIIVLCTILTYVSRATATIQLEALSIFFVIPAIILFIYGIKILSVLIIPWIYLALGLPIWNVVLGSLQYASRKISTIIGAKLLGFVYPVYHDNVHIYLPSITLYVAKECSGVSFLVAILAVGVPLVYLTQRSWLRATLVLIAGCALTILSNGLRIAMAGVMGQCFGPELLHGPKHILQGWLVAWLGWIAIFTVNWLVARGADESQPRLFERGKKSTVSPSISSGKSSNWRITGATLLLLGCTVFLHIVTPRPVPLARELASLPMYFSDWQGTARSWFPAENFFPGIDNQIARAYQHKKNGRIVYLYIGYYNKQTEAARLVSQHSRQLHKNTSKIVAPNILSSMKSITINHTTINIRGIQHDLVFWFQFPGPEIVLSRKQARITALKNTVTKRRNDGAIIIVATPIDNTETNSLSLIIDFLRSAGATILQAAPSSGR